MNIRDIVGFNVTHANHRTSFRTLFYSRGSEGEHESTLLLFEKGRAFFDFGKGPMTARRGHLLCFHSDSLKRTWPDPKSPPTYLIIGFDLFNRLGGLSRPADLGIPLLFSSAKTASIRGWMRKIISETRAKRKNHLVRCSILGLRLLQDLENSVDPAPASPCPGEFRPDERIVQAVEAMRAHYKGKTDVPALAGKAGLHPDSFRRLFKKAVGLTPVQYALHRKIEQAKENLVTDDLPIWEANDDLGFGDYSNFYRTFKKMTGMTPSAYRRKFRSGGP